jgi:hypothetical protein
MGGADPSAHRGGSITVSANPAAGVIRVSARERSAPAAAALADAVAQETQTIAGRLAAGAGGPRLVVGDFEDGPENWIVPSLFNAPPSSLSLTHSTARYNRTSLVATCVDTLGCGPSTRVYYPFQAGVKYTATAWLRGRPAKARVAMDFGSRPDDVTDTPSFAVRAGWRRVAVSWTPKSPSGVASVGIQTRSRVRTRIWVDGALVFDPRAARGGTKPIATAAQERRLFTQARYVNVAPARATGTVGDDAVRLALTGAAIGLAIACGAVGFGWWADRRRQGNPD